jgi:hypothetical protein
VHFDTDVHICFIQKWAFQVSSFTFQPSLTLPNCHWHIFQFDDDLVAQAKKMTPTNTKKGPQRVSNAEQLLQIALLRKAEAKGRQPFAKAQVTLRHPLPQRCWWQCCGRERAALSPSREQKNGALP